MPLPKESTCVMAQCRRSAVTTVTASPDYDVLDRCARVVTTTDGRRTDT